MVVALRNHLPIVRPDMWHGSVVVVRPVEMVEGGVLYDNEGLAYTGLGSVSIGGMVLGIHWLLVIGFVFVALGLLVYRLAGKRKVRRG